jgi:hypothetical protein
MHLNLESSVVSVSQVKSPHTPSPRLRHTTMRLYEDMYEEIVEIARSEGDMEMSAVFRELLTLALRYYKFKQGTLNPDSSQNEKTFYCQICGQMHKVRYRHKAIVYNEEYVFCEDCFFADKDKAFIIRQLKQM